MKDKPMPETDKKVIEGLMKLYELQRAQEQGWVEVLKKFDGKLDAILAAVVAAAQK